MADRLALYLSKSLAKYLIDNLGISCYVVSPDFDYDKKPDPSNPRNKLPRPLPFAAVELVSETREAFSVSVNILHESIIILNVMILESSYTECVNRTSDMRQALAQAAHPVSGKVGVPLYDFSTPSGGFYLLVNAVPIQNQGITTYIGPGDRTDLDNQKYQSVTPIEFSAFKDKDAVLLENVGNITINE